MIAYYRQTEAVDRCNPRIMDQCCLLFEMFIIRLFFKLLLNGSPNSLFHLCCRGFCKCNDQKSVYIHRLLVIGKHSDDSLYENCSLTGTCRCGYKNIPFPKIDYFLLALSPRYTHDCPSPFIA